MRRLSAGWILCLCLCLSPAVCIAGDQSQVCEEGRPSESYFKRLPGDTVNALPRSGYSARLQKLFDQAKAGSRTPIRFTQLPTEATDVGLNVATTQERIIALRAGMDRRLEENAIAHELLHIILQDQGYAGLVQVPITRTQRDALLADLGGAITSCVDDGVIDRRMAGLGFDPKVLNHDSAVRFRRQPPPPPADRLTIDGNALALFCFSQRLKAPADDVGTTWTKISPLVVSRSHMLAKQIGDIHCKDAGTCFTRKQRIRDVLGYPLRFCNPADGKYE